MKLMVDAIKKLNVNGEMTIDALAASLSTDRMTLFRAMWPAWTAGQLTRFSKKGDPNYYWRANIIIQTDLPEPLRSKAETAFASVGGIKGAMSLPLEQFQDLPGLSKEEKSEVLHWYLTNGPY